jgi:glycosyltransferase involved in cell wall biosynthesis
MKIGLAVIDVPASLGGGYVFRESIAQAALANPGRHSVDLVRTRPRLPRFEVSLSASFDQALTRGGMASLLSPARMRAGARQIVRRLTRPRAQRSASEIAPEVRSYVDWAIEQRLTWPNPDIIREFAGDITGKEYDLLWFNHMEPIHVGVPYIINVWDLQHRVQPWFPEVSDNGQFRQREACFAEGLQRAAFVITPSDETRAQVSQFYGVPADRVRSIHFPTPQPAIEGAASPQKPKVSEADLRAKFGISGPYLYYPAQFWPHKNHINLLHGLKVMREVHGLDFSMVFTGADHGNAAFVKAEAQRLGVADKVRFGGFVSYDEVMALYRHAFAMTYVTFFGPDNLPPLEAFAFGCPVVLSNIPGIEALYEDAVVPVDHRDGMSIAAGVKRLVDDPALRERCVAKGRIIANRNSVSNYVAQVQALCDEFEAVRRCWP